MDSSMSKALSYIIVNFFGLLCYLDISRAAYLLTRIGCETNYFK